MCLYPKLIKNRKYIANKKNGGIIPAITDNRVLMVPVGCGKCMECMKKKANGWKIRLGEEVREKKDRTFVTLTFSEESIKEISKGITLKGYNLDNEIATIAVRRFLERWRKKYKKSVRHWLITEIGGTRYERIHLHGIIESKDEEEIKKIWKYGYVYIGQYVNEQTVNYIVKYLHKQDEKHKEYTPKVLCSQGIGNKYTERIDSVKAKETGVYKNRQGLKLGLPIYYKNKILNEDEREKKWIELLNKNERWVNGQKIRLDKGDKEYNEAVTRARAENKKLGYGNDEINWDRKMYENNRRNLIKTEKLKNMSEMKKNRIIPEDIINIEHVKPHIPKNNEW